MKTIAEIRLENLSLLIDEQGTQDKVSDLSGVSPVYLSQLKNETRDIKTGRPRQMGDRTARKLETGCAKPIGWMDKEHAAATTAFAYTTAAEHKPEQHKANEVVALPARTQTYDIWTLAAIELLQSLDIGQRQAMVSRMREYKQFLDPPRIGQAL